MKAVTVKYARQETAEQKNRRIQSYDYLQKKQSEEPWIHCTYQKIQVCRRYSVLLSQFKNNKAFILHLVICLTEWFGSCKSPTAEYCLDSRPVFITAAVLAGRC